MSLSFHSDALGGRVGELGSLHDLPLGEFEHRISYRVQEAGLFQFVQRETGAAI